MVPALKTFLGASVSFYGILGGRDPLPPSDCQAGFPLVLPPLMAHPWPTPLKLGHSHLKLGHKALVSTLNSVCLQGPKLPAAS